MLSHALSSNHGRACLLTSEYMNEDISRRHLCVFMYAYIHAYVYAYVYTHAGARVCVCVMKNPCVCIRYIYIHIYTYMYGYFDVRVHRCAYQECACMSACRYTCTYILMHAGAYACMLIKHRFTQKFVTICLSMPGLGNCKSCQLPAPP